MECRLNEAFPHPKCPCSFFLSSFSYPLFVFMSFLSLSLECEWLSFYLFFFFFEWEVFYTFKIQKTHSMGQARSNMDRLIKRKAQHHTRKQKGVRNSTKVARIQAHAQTQNQELISVLSTKENILVLLPAIKRVGNSLTRSFLMQTTITFPELNLERRNLEIRMWLESDQIWLLDWLRYLAIASSTIIWWRG